jgi:phosphoesterase RecJ-like protein
VVDTGSWSQLDRLADYVRSFEGDVIVIDHHLQGDADVGAMRLVDTTAAAACQPVAGLCAALLHLPSPAALDPAIAEPLYLGLATDTGWFRHSNVSPAVFRLAADLVQAGVKHEQLFQTIEQRDRAARLGLMARALSSLEFALDGAAAIMTLTQADFEATGAAPQDVGGIVDLPRSVESVMVSALLTEQRSHEGPLTKISMRSKGGPHMIDVNVVTRSLGGGGHAQAAGARVSLTVADARAALIKAMT